MSSSSSDSETQVRCEVFQEFYRDNVSSDEPTIFNQPGLHFKQFTSDRIVFHFKPSAVIGNISTADRFRCVLLFDGNHWNIRRDSFPVNYKWRIYNIFWSKHYFKITDKFLCDAILLIYDFLCDWAKHYQTFTQEKFQRVKDGDSDVELFEDEEPFVFTEEEIEERRRKREEILKRMLPPVKTFGLERPRLRRRGRAVRSSSLAKSF